MIDDPGKVINDVADYLNANCGNADKLGELLDKLFDELQDLLIDMGDLSLNSNLFTAYLAAYIVTKSIMGNTPPPGGDSLTDDLLRLIGGETNIGNELSQYDIITAIRELRDKVHCR
ncbi:MAG: hypothetical protein AT710_05275 [Thermocladium sp. ECH_B]|jgi:hypothetical protein|nr:MAG: hypothetical protein AT710_05275 [Thermocladium sp. ECH_B]